MLWLSLALLTRVQAEVTIGNPVLSIAGWDVYADPQRPDKTIGFEAFEKEFGVRIEFTPLTHLDKIIGAAESGKDYDLFIISNDGIKSLYAMGLVQPLDLKLIPHYPELHHQLQYSEWSQFKGKIYAVPWAWGPTGLLYDASAMPEPTSWDVLWDPKYKGRMSLWDDVSMIWITALSLGYPNVYNLTKQQLAEVHKKLLILDSKIAGYYSGEKEIFDYIQKRGVVLLNSWFDPSARLRERGRDFKMVIPKEGAVGMFDSFLISRDTAKATLAHQFINYQISPAVQARMTGVTGLPPSNIEAMALITSQNVKALHLDQADYFNRMILWDIMPRKQLYEQIMQDVRKQAAARQKSAQ